MKDYKKLIVWQKSMKLVTDIYKLTKEMPGSERFGLISQINRSSQSIPSNIAEGNGRQSQKELLYFLNIAIGSSYELETQLLIVKNLNMISNENIDSCIILNDEIQKMLFGLKNKISVDSSKLSRSS
jgi:four helix bundle protein